MNLASAFAVSTHRQHQKIALFWGEREYSYGELKRLSTSVCGQLRERFHVRPGDRIGLWLKNCPEFIPALFGIWEAGGVVVPINNFLKPDEVNYILGDAGIDLLITDSELSGHFPALSAARPQLQVFKIEEIADRKPTPNTQHIP